MKISVEGFLPQRLETEDSLTFNEVQLCLFRCFPKVKIKQIGYVDPLHIGIIYVGNLTDAANAELIREIKQECGYET